MPRPTAVTLTDSCRVTLGSTQTNVYQYTQLWIDRLVEECGDEAGFLKVTGKPPLRLPTEPTQSDVA